MLHHEYDALEGFRFFGGSLSFYSVSCMYKVIFNPSLLNWSSHILTVAHIYIYTRIHILYNIYIYPILLHCVFNLCAPSCERFTCKRFWMSPSGFDLSSKTRSSSVAGPFLNPQHWCWKLFCTRMIIDDIWHHILEIRKNARSREVWTMCNTYQRSFNPISLRVHPCSSLFIFPYLCCTTTSTSGARAI